MTNPLPFAESFLCWQITCYGSAMASRFSPRSSRSAAILLRLLPALILTWAAGLNSTSLLLAATVLTGSILQTLAGRRHIPPQFLAEFEVAFHTLLAFALWRISLHAPEPAATLPLIEGITANRQAAACIVAAVFLFAIRSGSFVVYGLLEKAGGVPPQAKPASNTATHHSPGEMIGYIERAIVMLIVAAGNLQALAFFFVAKGLARSKKLEDDSTWANYFLLGSLASFFVALVCGLIAQQTLALLWK